MDARDAQPVRLSQRLTRSSENWVVYAATAGVFVLFAVVLGDRGFTNTENLLNILRQAVPIAIMACALVFVLSAGEIDLSFGSVVGLSALISALALEEGGIVLGVAAGLATGLAVGLLNGLLVTKLGIPSFLVTLATLELLAGVSRAITDLEAVAITNETFISIFGGEDLGPVSVLLFWGVVAGAVAWVIYSSSRFGAHVRATGDNRAAAATSGISTNRVRIAVLCMSGIAAAVAGMLLAGRLEGARYSLGEQDLLTVVAAAIIGGTSLFGGRGTIVGALVGAVLLSMINNGLILYGLDLAEQRIALGTILIIAVAVSFRERRP